MPFTLCIKTIIPINVLHNTLPIFGYRIGSFAYITDAKTISNSEIEKLKKKVAEKYGYKLVDHKLELYGIKKKS